MEDMERKLINYKIRPNSHCVICGNTVDLRRDYKTSERVNYFIANVEYHAVHRKCVTELNKRFPI